MNTLVDLLQTIENAVPDGLGEVTVTVVVVAVILAVRYLASRWISEHSHTSEGSRVRLAVSAVVAVTTGTGVVVLIGTWGLFDSLVSAYRDLGLGDAGEELVLAAVLLGGAYALTGFVGRVIEEVTGAHERISEHEREVIYRVTQITLYAVVGLVIVALFTRNVGSLLVGAGFVGIVVGLAARQTLGAVIAGFVLMFSRPFEVGDWVSIDGYEGVITEITVVSTRLRTVEGEYVTLPNDQVGANPITNRSREGRLRTEVEVGVDFDTDTERAAEIALTAVESLDEVLGQPPPRVVCKRFDDSAIVLGIRVWIDSPSAPRLWRTRTVVVQAVQEAFDDAGVEIPYPHRSLTTRHDGAVPLAGGDRRAEPEADHGGLDDD